MALSLPLGPDALVEEVIQQFPTVVPFLRQHGVVCMRCGEPVWGTLAEVIEAKGLDTASVLDALNSHLGSPD